MIPFLLGLFGALFYFGHSEVRHFENLAANDIHSRLHGDHAKVSVRTELEGIVGGALGDLKKVTIRASDFETPGLPLFTEPDLSKRGLIRDLRIELTEFTIAGLHIQELVSDIPDCRFDYDLAIRKHKIRLSQSGVGRGEVVIRARDLEAFILRKFGSIKRVSVKIADGRVLVQGYGEFLIVKANFTVDAKLVAFQGTKLQLSEAKIALDGREATPVESKTLMDALNPIVDLTRDLKLYDAIYVDEIKLEDDLLRAGGSTKIPNDPSNEKGPPGNPGGK
ncbi:MAG TPA: LmeA family phospholipid-binding protein [Fimbriimonadaceae bacterium]|nr:LmeA family phospholipid-binding protein [Fimbriimonadaceae bacterium]